jgi:hypothetical protein
MKAQHLKRLQKNYTEGRETSEKQSIQIITADCSSHIDGFIGRLQ